MPSYRPLALVTARLLARRWAFYLLVCAVISALSIAFVQFVHVKGAIYYPGLIAPGVVSVIVTVFVSGDATATWTLQERWARILERAWAIILIDIGIGFVAESGLASLQTSDVINTVFGFLTVLLSGMLVYAEPFAALENDVQTLTLIPFALLRSMMLAWVDISRIFALLAVQVAADALVLFAAKSVSAHGALAVEFVLPVVLEVPLAALFAIAYLDTVSQERRTLA